MRKLLLATALLILGTAGTAAADRYRGDYRRGDRRGYVQRDRGYQRDYRWNNYNRPVVNYRRPVYVNNGRYTFHDGRYFNYRRPVVNVRYTDYRYRPTLLVENYDTVPGYTWVAGNWQWNGYEWNWMSGHYEVNPSYSYAPVSNYEHDCD